MIKYKDYEIDETKDIFNLTPEEVFRYADSLPISKKRKLKFIDLYNTFKLNGVNNIDTSDDIPKFTFNGEIDLSNRKDSEVAGYVVDYLNRGLRKKYTSLTKEKEEKEKNIPLYTNESFQNDIQEQIIRDYFKGRRDVNLNKEWDDVLDKRNEETGLYSTEGRAKVFSEQLRNYANSLKEDSYKFDETTPFKSLDEFKTALNSAADKLANNDLSGLNDIGFPQSKWFSDRGEDPFTDSEGNTYTAKDYYSAKYLQELKKLEEEVLALQLKQAKIDLGNKGVIGKIGGIHAVEARNKAQDYQLWLATSRYGTGLLGFNKMNARILQLIDQATTSGLTGADKKELGNLLYYVRDKNPHYQGLGNGKQTNISDAEWNELRLHTDQLSSVTRENFIRLPWQVLSGNSKGRYVYADNQGNLYFLKPQNHLKFNLTFNRETGSAYTNYKNNFLKSQNTKFLNTTIGDNKGLTDDMKADLAAMGLDLVSAGSAFVPGYGTALSAITGVSATLSGAIADRMRGESWGSTLGTAGFGLTMDILGLVPGIGVAGKASKIARIISKGAKWVGPALGGLSAMAYGPGALSAYKKMISGNSNNVTAEELRDFTYAIRAIAAGGIRKTGATYLGNRTLARAQKAGRASITSAKESAFITTKNGQQIKLTDEEFKTLSSNASRENKTKIISKAAKREKINMEGDEIEWKGINPIKRRFTSSSESSKLSGLNKPLEASQLKWNTTNIDYRGIKRFSNENFLRNYTQIGGSGIWQSIKDRWTGRDILNSLTTNNVTSVQNSSKILGLPRKPYTSPKYRSLELIPEERRLPENLTTNGIVDVLKVNSRPKSNLSIRESLKEINNWIDSYGLNSKRSKFQSIKGGYDSSKPLENGIYNYEIPTSSGEKIPIILNKSNNEIVVTLKGKSKSFKRIEEARQYMSQQIYDLTKKVNYTEIAQTLKEFKRTNGLKQGGIIDKQRILKYKEYIRK